MSQSPSNPSTSPTVFSDPIARKIMQAARKVLNEPIDQRGTPERRRPFDEPGFWAKITCYKRITDGVDQWKYGFMEMDRIAGDTWVEHQYQPRSGNPCCNGADGDNSTCVYALNAIEADNAGGIEGNSVDSTKWTMVAVRGNPIVWMRQDYTSGTDVVYTFAYENDSLDDPGPDNTCCSGCETQCWYVARLTYNCATQTYDPVAWVATCGTSAPWGAEATGEWIPDAATGLPGQANCNWHYNAASPVGTCCSEGNCADDPGVTLPANPAPGCCDNCDGCDCYNHWTAVSTCTGSSGVTWTYEVEATYCNKPTQADAWINTGKCRWEYWQTAATGKCSVGDCPDPPDPDTTSPPAGLPDDATARANCCGSSDCSQLPLKQVTIIDLTQPVTISSTCNGDGTITTTLNYTPTTICVPDCTCGS